MIKMIDKFLNKITMYRLVFYELLFLLAAAAVLGLFQLIPYSPLWLAFSTVFIFIICWSTNKIFAKAFDVPSNPESVWITALILALIISPASSFSDGQFLSLAFWASASAIASKYILAVRGKHIFNPAAMGVALPALFLGLSASWWVGTPVMLPFVLVGGLLIVRKIHRFDLFLAFIVTFATGILLSNFSGESDLLHFLSQSLLYAPPFFFATVMLTEPATTPPNRSLRIAYGILVGLFFLPNFNIASFYFTPELALLAGNIFSYLVSPKYKLRLRLKRTTRLSPDIYEFAFAPERPISYKPGQYMEMTLPHSPSDSRSLRRYFTLASSPTEREVSLGIKFYQPASTFKKTLLGMKEGESMVASQLAGGFTLPEDKNKKLVFIAGGIGITPFRSMIKYLLDKKERRPIILFYSNKSPADAVYRDLFDRAEKELGMELIYAFTDRSTALPEGAAPEISGELVKKRVPDYADRIFYISGPQGMVTSFRETLIQAGVHRRAIKTDYFPGFA